MTDLTTPMAWLSWRDCQLEAISEQLEDALPELIAQLEALIDQSKLWNLMTLGAGQGTIIDKWKAEQLRRAVQLAEEAMTEALRTLPPESALTGDSGLELGTILPAAAGVGLLAASIAAIPTVASFATVTSSSLAIFTVSTVSWPLLVVGAAGVATAAAVGSTLLNRAEADWRKSIKARLRTKAYRHILGLGAQRGARSFLSDLQAVIILVGKKRMEERL